MKIEDCKVGMKVETENGEYTIDEIYKEMVRFKGWTHFLSAKDVEPVNKFEVGDEVLFDGREKCKIIFVADQKDRLEQKYLCDFESEGEHYYEMIQGEALSPLKRKDELEVGDKFKANCGRKYKILFVEKDDFHNKMAYFSKTINGTYKGVLRIFYPNDVEEIIYD